MASLLAVVVVSVLPAIASAEVTPAATFSSSQRISAPGQDAFQPRVGLDGEGNAVFMWVRWDGANNRAEARTRSATGVLSSVQVLSAAGQNAWMHDLAVNAAGHAIFAWVRSDGTNMRVQIRTRSAAGIFSGVQTVSPPGFDGHHPTVALDADGNALVAWQGHDGTFFRIRARRRSAGGALGTIKTLSEAGEAGWAPQIAMRANGRAIVTWYRHDGSTYRVQLRERGVDGQWSGVRTISPPTGGAQNPQVAFGPDGTAVFVWTLGGANILVQSRTLTPAGTLRAVQTLSWAGQNALRPRVAVDGDGNAVFVWYRSDGVDLRVQMRTRSATGELSAVENLSLSGADSSNPEVAVDVNGNVMVVWERFDGTTARVQARPRAADGTLGGIRTLASSPEDGMAPVLAMTPDGNVVFAWAADDGTDWRIFTSRATVP